MKKRNRYRSMTIGMRAAPRLRSNASIIYVTSWRKNHIRKKRLVKMNLEKVPNPSPFWFYALLLSPGIIYHHTLLSNTAKVNSIKHFSI